mgnify:CR=1 FL=1
MAYESPLTIAEVVKDISANKYVLPSIQREFVWSIAQIERLFDSVMQDYCFIFWRYKRWENWRSSTLILIQECLGILAARCASCNCMTYFYCAPLQSCRRLYQLGDWLPPLIPACFSPPIEVEVISQPI